MRPLKIRVAGLVSAGSRPAVYDINGSETVVRRLGERRGGGGEVGCRKTLGFSKTKKKQKESFSSQQVPRQPPPLFRCRGPARVGLPRIRGISLFFIFSRGPLVRQDVVLKISQRAAEEKCGKRESEAGKQEAGGGRCWKVEAGKCPRRGSNFSCWRYHHR